jgi:hypothetical protein
VKVAVRKYKNVCCFWAPVLLLPQISVNIESPSCNNVTFNVPFNDVWFASNAVLHILAATEHLTFRPINGHYSAALG